MIGSAALLQHQWASRPCILAQLTKIDSGTSRSTTCSELFAYQHMLLVDLLVQLRQTRATSELMLIAYGPRR